jgi:DNA alkylation repair enzyme
MDLKTTMAALEKLGTAQTRKTWTAHGATGEFFGVKIGDMKGLLKKIKGRQDLALDLYATGNLDAMYLAGLVADGSLMSRKALDGWASAARGHGISEYTVAWVASEHPDAREIALKWIDSPKPHVAAAGWNTYSGLVSTRPDEQLDLKEIQKLLTRVEKEIHDAPNRVRYCMNGFVIATGCMVAPLTARAKDAAKKIGTVEVDMDGTECKVPSALEKIAKVASMGRIGKKRKTMKC